MFCCCCSLTPLLENVRTLKKSLSLSVSKMNSISFLPISSRNPVMLPLVSNKMRISLGDAAAMMYHD